LRTTPIHFRWNATGSIHLPQRHAACLIVSVFRIVSLPPTRVRHPQSTS
jgi:hypothetical protein